MSTAPPPPWSNADDPNNSVYSTVSFAQTVVTLSGDVRVERPVTSIGRRRIDLAARPHSDSVSPIRIRRDATADGVPHTDLLVSPDHAVFLGGRLILARQLLNGSTVLRQTGWQAVKYFHIELESYALLLAEGLPAESYLDTGNRDLFANADEALVLHPDLKDAGNTARRESEYCVPFTCDADTVHPTWQRLVARAARWVSPRCRPQPPRIRISAWLPRDAPSTRFRQTAIVRSLCCPAAPRSVLVAGLVVRAGTEMWSLPLDAPWLAQG
jgi:hypothetical protein